MQCSTEVHFGKRLENPQATDRVLQDWSEVQKVLPDDLEALARETGALLRKREIRSAGDLLRMVLYYATSDESLRLVAAWALAQGIGYLSDVAVLQRLRHCSRWIGQLIGLLLQRRCQGWEPMVGFHLRLMDATVISRPGSKGVDWRIHLVLNLGQMCLEGVEVTDAHGGETLARFAPLANEIRVADRGHAFASGLGPLLATFTGLVVRINWQNLPLEQPDGQRFPLIPWLKSLAQPAEQDVWLSTPQGHFALRLLACPLSPAAAEQARQRARKNNSKKGRQVSEQTLLAAGFLLLVTNLPPQDWPLERVFWLYRLRWQIETYIKRLKSLLQLDHLRAQDPQLAKTYLLGKLLAALLLEELTQQLRLQQPGWFLSLARPVSPWRLTALLWSGFCQLVCGRVSLVRWFQILPALRRYLCDAPRGRPQQLAWARALLEHLALSFSFFGC